MRIFYCRMNSLSILEVMQQLDETIQSWNKNTAVFRYSKFVNDHLPYASEKNSWKEENSSKAFNSVLKHLVQTYQTPILLPFLYCQWLTCAAFIFGEKEVRIKINVWKKTRKNPSPRKAHWILFVYESRVSLFLYY